jgi:hypothetical protein
LTLSSKREYPFAFDLVSAKRAGPDGAGPALHLEVLVAARNFRSFLLT